MEEVYLVNTFAGHTVKAFRDEQAAWDWCEEQDNPEDYDVETMEIEDV